MEENSNQPAQHLQPVQSIPQVQTSAPSPQNSLEKKSSSSLPIYAGGAVLIVLFLGMITYILFAKANKKSAPIAANTNQSYKSNQQSNSLIPTSTPGITPVTASNVGQTLINTDASMQQSLNQMNTDFSDLNSIDTTQDNPNNL